MDELRKELEKLKRQQADFLLAQQEDRQRVMNVEKKVNIMENVFEDLKTVDREHSSHLLLAQPLILDIDESERSRCYCCCL